MRLVATRKSEQNRAGLDPWTLVHLSAGLALGLLDVPLRRSLAAAAVYELAEQVFERTESGQGFFRTSGPEVVLISAVDLAVLVAGHWLGQRWNAT